MTGSKVDSKAHPQTGQLELPLEPKPIRCTWCGHEKGSCPTTCCSYDGNHRYPPVYPIWKGMPRKWLT